MIPIILSFFIIIIILYIVNVYFNRQGKPPGPLGLPILGYLPFLNADQPYLTLTKLAEKYGPIYGLQLGSIYTVILSDPTIIRDALKREEFTGRAPLYITHGIMGGYGLICAEGNLWRDQRKLSIEWLRKIGMVKFGSSRVELETRILNAVEEAVTDLDDESKKTFGINTMHILHHSMGNLINDIVFGLKYDKNNETWRYLQHLQEEGVKHIGVSGVINFIPILRHLPSNKKTIEFLLTGKEKTHKIYDEIIEERRKLNNEEGQNILSCFLKEKMVREEENSSSLKYCTDIQLRHLLADLFGAGVDTTLTTLRWFLLYIALDDNVQDKIRNEMKKVLRKPPTLGDVVSLPYLRACISEAQRIRSVVPLGIPHGAIQDTHLEGYKIPKNTMIMPLQWAVHMNPQFWVDPETFNPSRFINESGEYFAPPHFLPFQTGKRMCLGDELAKMILFSYASRILYNFEMSILDKHNLSMSGTCGITLTPPQHDMIFKKKQVG